MGSPKGAAHGFFVWAVAVSTLHGLFIAEEANHDHPDEKNATEGQIDDVTTWSNRTAITRTCPGAWRERSSAPSATTGARPSRVGGIPAGVEKIVPILKPYKLASREFREENTQIRVGDAVVGGPKFVVWPVPAPSRARSSSWSRRTSRRRAGRTSSGGAYKPADVAVQLPGHGKRG